MMERRVALVTGASRGIGRSICIDLARHGFDVAACARSLSESAVAWPGTVEETAQRVRAHGARALPIAADLRDQGQIRAAVDATLAEFGRIDVLITSATNIDFSEGGTYLSKFVDTRWEALEDHVTINITSTLLLMRLVLPVMVQQGSGIIMNVTQNCEWINEPVLPMPGEGMCGFAIPVTRGVTDRIAPAIKREVAPHGVTVLTFDPGLTLSISDLRYQDTGKAGFIPSMAHSVCVPARAATYLATCPNPAAFNGEFVIAADLVRKFGLLTEDEIMPDTSVGVADIEKLGPLPGWQ
jgi:NAD(P)-dependent dehydrogenase (short-subunit alcohol dehydrogenase family)